MQEFNKGKYQGWTTTSAGEWVKKLPHSGLVEGNKDPREKRFYSGKVIASREFLIKKFNFTEKEMEIIVHLVDGRSNQAIADRIFRQVKTVKWHLTEIYKKLNVVNRAQAIASILIIMEGNV